MRAGGVGASSHPKHPELRGRRLRQRACFGVQEYAICTATALRKVDPKLAPLPRVLGALGMPGMTAYFGLLDVGQPKAGETVVVSGAAGAVGAAVGQIAKIKGCRAVGIAGGAEKCRYVVDELGFDAAIDYKAEDVAHGLQGALPEGHRRLLRQRRRRDPRRRACPARRAAPASSLCGAISQYNNTSRSRAPRTTCRSSSTARG